jgi:DNA-binding GntR family transcriptional regulator
MPQHFARSVARLGGMVATRCGNQHLARLLRDQLDHTLWGFIWRDRPLDFFTPRRQMAAVREWEELAAAIEIGKDDEAERSQKRIFLTPAMQRSPHFRRLGPRELIGRALSGIDDGR